MRARNSRKGHWKKRQGKPPRPVVFLRIISPAVRPQHGRIGQKMAESARMNGRIGLFSHSSSSSGRINHSSGMNQPTKWDEYLDTAFCRRKHTAACNGRVTAHGCILSCTLEPIARPKKDPIFLLAGPIHPFVHVRPWDERACQTECRSTLLGY